MVAMHIKILDKKAIQKTWIAPRLLYSQISGIVQYYILYLVCKPSEKNVFTFLSTLKITIDFLSEDECHY